MERVQGKPATVHSTIKCQSWDLDPGLHSQSQDYPMAVE